jgi:hypothetical protein
MSLAIAQQVLAEMGGHPLAVKKLGEGGQGPSSWSRGRTGPRP